MQLSTRLSLVFTGINDSMNQLVMDFILNAELSSLNEEKFSFVSIQEEVQQMFDNYSEPELINANLSKLDRGKEIQLFMLQKY